MTIAIEYFFMCLLAIYILAFVKWSSKSFAFFYLDYFFIVDLQEFIMYFGASPWSDIHCLLFIY